MVNFGDRHDEPAPRQQRDGPADRPGHLEDLREQDQTGVAALSRRSKHIGSHRAVRRGEVHKVVVFKDHGALQEVCVQYSTTVGHDEMTEAGASGQ